MNTSAHANSHPVPPPPLLYRLMQALMSPVMQMAGLSCRQFAELAATRLDRPLGRWESLRFHFHRAMCDLCRRLPAQLENLRALTRCACLHTPEEETAATQDSTAELSPEARERIRAALVAETPPSTEP